MTRLGARLDLQALIARHNDPANDYHLDLHKVVCIGSQWSDGVSFMELTTMHLLLNIGRAMQSGWELQVQADGSFEFCASKLALLFSASTRSAIYSDPFHGHSFRANLPRPSSIAKMESELPFSA